VVRSKGESPREARDLFHLVEHIRATEKYFDCSRDEIERELIAEGYYEVYSDLEIDADGEKAVAKLRLNLTGASASSQRWAIALKLHDVRIDGIDYEPRFLCADGSTGRGWHRHVFDGKARNAERGKVEVPGFGSGLDALDTFLIRAFGEMRILVNKHDGGYTLPLG
jgi:hypothetical protein